MRPMGPEVVAAATVESEESDEVAAALRARGEGNGADGDESAAGLSARLLRLPRCERPCVGELLLSWNSDWVDVSEAFCASSIADNALPE